MQTPIQPVDFKDIAADVKANSGQLATIKGLTLRESSVGLLFAPEYADSIGGRYTWIGKNKNYVHHSINLSSLSQTVIVRTSTYAKFANNPMPTGTVDVTGIATRYNSTWQILLRDERDVKAY
jgi:hypothetical protein